MRDMKLWKVWREEGAGYDEYDACVVADHTEAAALMCDPSEADRGWCATPERLLVECIGTARQGAYEPGDIVVASFNAG